MSFEIEYPDGHRRERAFEGSDGVHPEAIQATVFDDGIVREGGESNSNVSDDDWEQNPTMGVYFPLWTAR